MMERIGGVLGAAFYGVQALALGGGVAVALAGGDLDGWFRWTLPPLISLGMVLLIGLPLAGAAKAAWEIFIGQGPDPGTKTCSCCGRELPALVAYFYRRRGDRGGLDSRCRRCAAAAFRFHHAIGERQPEKTGDSTEVYGGITPHLRTS